MHVPQRQFTPHYFCFTSVNIPTVSWATTPPGILNSMLSRRKLTDDALPNGPHFECTCGETFAVFCHVLFTITMPVTTDRLNTNVIELESLIERVIFTAPLVIIHHSSAEFYIIMCYFLNAPHRIVSLMSAWDIAWTYISRYQNLVYYGIMHPTNSKQGMSKKNNHSRYLKY